MNKAQEKRAEVAAIMNFMGWAALEKEYKKMDRGEICANVYYHRPHAGQIANENMASFIYSEIKKR